MKQVTWTITENTPLTPDTYRLRLAGDTEAITAPGQFVNLKLSGFYLRRPISVCDWEPGAATLIYKVLGHGTAAMTHLPAGTELDVLTGLGNGYDTSLAGERPLLVGGGVGVMGELMFTSVGIGIDMSLQWNMHGSKLHFDEYPVFAPTKTTTSYLHTLQLPINIRYKYTRLNGFEEKLAPFVYGGPMFSVTVGHNKVEPLEYPGGCFGLQCGIGAEIYRHWQVSAGYVWGMTYELRTRKLDNYSARCQYWQLKVAYLF